MKICSRPEPGTPGQLRPSLADLYTIVTETVEDNPHLNAKAITTGVLSGLVRMGHIDDFVVSNVNYGSISSTLEVSVKIDFSDLAPFHTFLIHY